MEVRSTTKKENLRVLVENVTTSTITRSCDKIVLVSVSQNRVFTGRETLVKEVVCLFKSNREVQQRVVLTGLVGVGKTQIATAFAYEIFASEVLPFIF